MTLKNKNFKDKNDKHKYKQIVKYENKVELGTFYQLNIMSWFNRLLVFFYSNVRMKSK